MDLCETPGSVRVPFFDMQLETAPLRRELDAAIARVLDTGVFVGGPEVAGFEHELARRLRVSHAIGVSSGTDALHVIALALGIGSGDDVVTTPFSFFATCGSFARLGARIVFADVDEDTLTLDPRLASSSCSAHTRAIITVHLFGHPAPVAGAPCPVIEDAAQAIGVPLRGLVAALSFFPTKQLGALGDAGAVVTQDATLAERVRLLRTHGASPKYHHVAIGGNFRLDALQAAALRVKLAQLDAALAARRRIAARYREALAAAKVPPELRPLADHPEHTYQQFVIRAPRRDALRRFLADRGIGTEVYYPEPLHLQPCFRDLGYRPGSLPIAERAAGEVLALPLQAQLPPAAVETVVSTIEAFFGS
jgi:dTDP-4-amino-4,6-dideoxygalactose transaminase